MDYRKQYPNYNNYHHFPILEINAFKKCPLIALDNSSFKRFVLVCSMPIQPTRINGITNDWERILLLPIRLTLTHYSISNSHLIVLPYNIGKDADVNGRMNKWGHWKSSSNARFPSPRFTLKLTLQLNVIIHHLSSGAFVIIMKWARKN